jgi:molybdopterin/thiamine biosynthesis adenylyltransferase
MTLQEVVKFLRDILRDIHNRTPPDLVVRDRIMLVGAGGVGTWTAVALTLSADHGFRLLIIDDDQLEPHNLNRLPYTINDALRKLPKAALLQRYLKWLRPWLWIKWIDDKVDSVEKGVMYALMHGAEIIIDAVDNPRSIRILKDVAKAVGAHYLGVHYDGTSITIEWIPREYFSDTDWIIDEDQAGYTVFPSCAFVPMFIGSLAAFIVAVKPQRKLFLSCDLRKSLEPPARQTQDSGSDET